MSGLIKRSFSLAGHRTSVALEPAFWEVLRAAAQSRSIALSGLVAAVDAERDGTTPLASALRLRALREALASTRATAPEAADPGVAPAPEETSPNLTET